MTLDELEKGMVARITGIDGNDKLRRRLLNFEISIDSEVQFLRKAPLGNPLELLVGDNMVAIRRNIAQKIQIEIPVCHIQNLNRGSASYGKSE